jgi:iron complex outermembrane recepter protein
MRKIMGTTASLLLATFIAAQYSTTPLKSPSTDSLLPQISPLFLQPLEVRSIRASDKAPFAKTNIGKAEIAQQNLGADIPFLLNQTPSAVINSDAGNGVGYTGIRIRGTDATRINVTLNGIPFNDAESMGSFFVNLPDFASSVNSIQIQRGVGTSSNGASAFGATLNMSTNEFNEKAYVELNNSFGSFTTWKNTLKLGTGLINKHFTVDARLSSIRSNGFIDRASSNLKSFYLSGAYINEKSSLRLNVFSGHEKTYQSWYGVAENLLKTKRTDNPAGTEKPGEPYENQTDNYTQTHYQLFYNRSISTKWFLNTAVFLTRGKGYYEEYKADQRFARYGLPNIVVAGNTITKTDLVRQRWLDNYFYGQIASLQYKGVNNEITFGGGWSQYKGDHFGTLPWLNTGKATTNYRYYDLPAHKNDAHFYTKWQHQLAPYLTSFVDVQYRFVSHTMNGFHNTPTLNISRNFNFLNPKLGLNYARNGLQIFGSFAIGNKEPNREDFEAGLVAQPIAETLQDWELGIEKKTAGFSYGANVYFMNYLNQLVLTGQINDVGAYTRTNIPKSYRLGVELQSALIVKKWLTVAGNIAFSKNKINSFTEYIDNYDTGLQDAIEHTNTNISFSPGLVGGTTITITPFKQTNFSFLSKYVGKQYLDNTQNEARKTNGFFVQDFRLVQNLTNKLSKSIQLILQVNNILDAQYEPNGYTFSYVSGGTRTSENFYFPMAGRNFMLAVNVAF